jgi:hypothetical protein
MHSAPPGNLRPQSTDSWLARTTTLIGRKTEDLASEHDRVIRRQTHLVTLFIRQTFVSSPAVDAREMEKAIRSDCIHLDFSQWTVCGIVKDVERNLHGGSVRYLAT